MHSRAKLVPLTRRLTSRYLMFGLACLLVCIAISLTFASRGTLAHYAPLTIILPLLILLIGALILKQTVRLNSEIEQQLRRIASITSPEELKLQPMEDGDPAASGWNIILERVTSSSTLAKIETRLCDSLDGLRRRKLELALNRLPDGIATSDQNGAITFMNNSLKALVNIDADDQLTGKRMEEILPRSASIDFTEIQDRLREPSRGATFELQRTDHLADGVLRVARYPLTDGDEAMIHHLWSVRDITQQKLADEMRSQFVSNATHELRTPLSNIKAYAETLTLHKGIEVEEQKKFINTINSEATRLSRFVDELLNVSQMEAGSLALVRHETDVRNMLEEVVEHAKPLMTQKRIDFQSFLPPKLPKLHVDKDKVTATLVNLLGNAAKYTPEDGRVAVHVEVNSDQIQVQIEDSGIGISEEDLPKVFDTFFRSSDERVQEISGSGLGLSFAREVTRLHGGKLTLQSELNKGTKFTMTLPIS